MIIVVNGRIGQNKKFVHAFYFKFTPSTKFHILNFILKTLNRKIRHKVMELEGSRDKVLETKLSTELISNILNF